MRIFIKMSEIENTLSGKTRLGSYSKKMILKKCWLSLVANLTAEDSVIIFYNDVQKSTLQWLQKQYSTVDFVEANNIEENWNNLANRFKQEIEEETTPDAVYAIFDDDILWTTDAFKNTIKPIQTTWKGFITPNDSMLNYTLPRACKIALGLKNYWRTTTNLTFNIIGTKAIFNDYMSILYPAIVARNIDGLERILQSTESIIPLPAVATHCVEEDMSPFVNWDFIWRGITI